MVRAAEEVKGVGARGICSSAGIRERMKWLEKIRGGRM